METATSPSALTAGRILIVDDHPNTAATLARAIAQVAPNFEIITAENGEKALDIVKDKIVTLLITDLIMPGMTGLELIEKMQAHPGGKPAYIALVTAYDVPGLKETARRLKVNEVVNKPVHPERICEIVTKAIRELGNTSPAAGTSETKAPFKILVADDHEDNIALLTRYLENEGYLCLHAADGEETLAKARSEMPDLVLLDVNMPVKDGFEALQEIRKDASIGHIPVIILTAARLEPMDMQYALGIGADDYITKPFDRRELLARIRTRLRVKETEDYIRRRNKELNLLPEIGRELSARLDINELIDLVLRRTVETLGALAGHILLLTSDGPLHQSHSISTTQASAGDASLPAMADLLTAVKEYRQGFIINDTRSDSRWKVVPGETARSAVVVPMLGRLEMLGMLILVHEQVGYFHLEHRLLLQAIASQAAIAVENARLFARTAGGQPNHESSFQGAIQAALFFDEHGKVQWQSPLSEKFFLVPPFTPGSPLPAGGGYEPLIELLEEVRSSGKSKAGQITLPGNRIITAALTPLENGGYLTLLYMPASEAEMKPAAMIVV